MIQYAVEGSFHIQKGKMLPNGEKGPVNLDMEFKNLVTNNGLNLMGSGAASAGDLCCVGSGATPPAPTQTALVALVASKAIASGGKESYRPGIDATSGLYFGSIQRTYEFAAGAAAGNLAEIGVGSTATSLFSRALITDTAGSPTTITVLSDEFLTVTYRLRSYVDPTDRTGSIQINGVAHTFTIRPLSLNDTPGSSFAHWSYPLLQSDVRLSGINGGVRTGPYALTSGLQPFTSDSIGSGALDGDSQISDLPYVAGSFRREHTIRFPLDAANTATGIRTVQFSNTIGMWQVEFDPPIVKNSTQVLTFTLESTWGRYAPGG